MFSVKVRVCWGGGGVGAFILPRDKTEDSENMRFTSVKKPINRDDGTKRKYFQPRAYIYIYIPI